MKRILFTITAISLSICAYSQSLPLGNLRYAGPFPAKNPVMIDQKDVKASEFDESKLLDIPIKYSLLENGQQLSTFNLPPFKEGWGGSYQLPKCEQSILSLSIAAPRAAISGSR